MIISRRPNRRASIEIAPGPRRASAAESITTDALIHFASPRLTEESEKRANAAAPTLSPITTAAMGVRNPITTSAPLAISRIPTINAEEAIEFNP